MNHPELDKSGAIVLSLKLLGYSYGSDLSMPELG
jgi:hypothetical protein